MGNARREDPDESHESSRKAEKDEVMARKALTVFTGAGKALTDAELARIGNQVNGWRFSPDRWRHGRLALQRMGRIEQAGTKQSDWGRPTRTWKLRDSGG